MTVEDQQENKKYLISSSAALMKFNLKKYLMLSQTIYEKLLLYAKKGAMS